eukprot:gene3988-2843_t
MVNETPVGGYDLLRNCDLLFFFLAFNLLWKNEILVELSTP